MIRVIFEKDRISVLGHADFDEYGKDIVCAAVSSVVQYTGYLLKAFGGDFEKEKGRFVIYNIPKKREAEIAIEILKESLKSIERKFPDHLKVEVI